MKNLLFTTGLACFMILGLSSFTTTTAGSDCSEYARQATQQEETLYGPKTQKQYATSYQWYYNACKETQKNSGVILGPAHP